MAFDKPYPLDWKTQEVRLDKGRFVHTVNRPTPDQVIDRDKDLQQEIPIGKDGSYKLPDPTATEEVDVPFYDKIKIAATGYPGETVPAVHKAAVITGLYQREIYVPEDTDKFADEIPVIEEVGQGDEPDFTITHWLRQPTEDELKKFRRRNGAGEIKPGKRGRQTFVTKSNLRLMMEYYALWMDRIEGGSIEAGEYRSELREDYIHHVDPLIQRRVVQAFVEAVSGGLLD